MEHGPFPRLSTIALGVTLVYQSTLAGLNIDPRHQSLKEAAHPAEVGLQSIRNARKLPEAEISPWKNERDYLSLLGEVKKIKIKDSRKRGLGRNY